MIFCARPTPSSARIRRPSSSARSAISWSSTARRIRAASRGTVSDRNGSGAGPAPSAATRSPQYGWSPKNGHTTVGAPARSPAAVVPAPP